MLENWLTPVKADLYTQAAAHSFGKKVLKYQAGQQLPDGGMMTLIGIDADAANLVREHLYKMSFPFGKNKVVDLGDVRKKNADFVIPLFEELLRSKQNICIIGGKSDVLDSQFMAYRDLRNLINIAWIDDRIPADSGSLGSVLTRQADRVFAFSGVGYQSQLVPRHTLDILASRQYENVRLGMVRATPEHAEPLLRDADLAVMQLRSIRAADMPAQFDPSPIGLSIEEACRLARYCGMSDKLSSFGLAGIDTEHAAAPLTAHGMAQIVWYFLDGYDGRKGDYPVSTDGLIEYVVTMDKSAKPLTFWKSRVSGRWWLEIPAKKGQENDMQYHHLLPCSYEDYVNVSQGELPDRIITAFSRYEKR